MLRVFRAETAKESGSLTHFQFKMKENGRKNRLRDKQTTKKILLMFLDGKLLTQM